MSRSLADLHPDWPQYATRLRDGVKDLTPEQLDLRIGPDHAPIWALTAHVAGTRAYWLCGVFEQPGAETTPFTEPLTGPGWEDDLTHPRSGAELAWALDTTWAVIRDVLERWTVDADCAATALPASAHTATNAGSHRSTDPPFPRTE